MAGNSNKDKDKDPAIDAVLDETPPDINEPQDKPEDTDIPDDEILKDPDNEEPVAAEDETPEDDTETPAPPTPTETPEQKEQRYKAQQAEAQIQVERNKALTQKVEEAAKIGVPTVDELKAFVKEDGISWDELTNFEQATARRTYIAEKRFQLVNESVQEAKKVDEWAGKVDEFIDLTDGKPEFIELSSYEADFRKFAMKEAHRGTPVDILLSAFLHNLPTKPKNRGSIFNQGGGGEAETRKTGLTDADTVAKLRTSDPKEYKRQVKAGKIKLDV